MSIITHVLLLFAIIIIFALFFGILPIELYYYSPLLISSIGSLILGFLLYFEIKSFSNHTTAGFIATFACIILIIIYLQKYQNKLTNMLIQNGKQVTAKVEDKQIKSGSFHEQHYIKYTYQIDNIEIKKSELVNPDLYKKIEIGQEINIRYLPRNHKITLIMEP